MHTRRGFLWHVQQVVEVEAAEALAAAVAQWEAEAEVAVVLFPEADVPESVAAADTEVWVEADFPVVHTKDPILITTIPITLTHTTHTTPTIPTTEADHTADTTMDIMPVITQAEDPAVVAAVF